MVEILENGSWVKANGKLVGKVESHRIDKVEGQPDLVYYKVVAENGETREANQYHVQPILHPKNVQKGEGATIIHYTDRSACTVIDVAKNGKQITLQRDSAKRLTKPIIIPGGFAGHCINNDDIEYEYSRNEQGATCTANWSNKYGCYKVGGSKGEKVMLGRSEKYDYNF